MIRIISHILPDFSIFTGLHTHCRLKFNTIKAKTLFLFTLFAKVPILEMTDFFFFFAVACLPVYLGKYGLSVSSYFPASREAPYLGKREGTRQGYQIMLKSYACPTQGHSAMAVKGFEVHHVVPLA